MTEEELREINPDLVDRIYADAAKAERERQKGLDAMMHPSLTTIIERARKDGKKPEDIVMEANAILREELESTAHMDKLRKDAHAAGKPPVGDAPWILQPGARSYEPPKAMSMVNGRKRR